jgi:hypothetical protein
MLDSANFVGWLWPVPMTNLRYPVISNGFVPGARYNPDGSLNYAVHLGVDIMFQRLPSDPTGPETDVAIPKHGDNPGWITWPDTRIMSAGPGEIWEAKETHLGHSVLVDHGKVGGVGMLTFYQHLASLEGAWKRGDTVFPGLVLGRMGGDPSNAPHLRHLHFEVWLPDDKPHESAWPVDPAQFLKMWAKL